MNSYNNLDINKLSLEKQDAEMFLKLIAPKYMGVYILDSISDTFRDIIGPDYFREYVKNNDGYFSKAMFGYINEFVDVNYKNALYSLLDYDVLNEELKRSEKVERLYRKKDGTLVKVTVKPYSNDELFSNLSIWLFTNEESGDAILSSLGEARWSLELNKKGEMVNINFNEVILNMLGYNVDNNFHSDVKDVFLLYIHPEDYTRTINAIKESLDSKGEVKLDIEHRFKCKSGEYKWFRSIAKPIFNKNSNTIFYGMFIDITNQKHLEFKRQKELADALESAQYANSAKTKFLNNMSHDIRTPMNAIIGFTALAARHIDNKERVKDCLEKITTSSAHLLSLINDVLDMSRIESGKLRLDENRVHLPDLFHDLRTILQTDITSKNIDLLFDTLGIVNEDVICDRLRLNQILLNLLSNALKFTDDGGVISVRISQKQSDKNGYAKYEIRVKDSGIGMSEKFLEHVFEPFAREHSSTISGVDGTGLGLAITKNIVDMMGGTIEVHSKENEGSEFICTLEFKTCEINNNEIIEELQDIKALVVDDDMNTCSSVCEILQSIGLRPDWTTSGKEAIFRTQFAIDHADSYKVFIIDWLMPDMNGIEIVKRIRKIIGNETPIIIMTAYDWSDIEEEARAAGVTDFCAKPIFPSDIKDILRKPFNVKEKVEVKETKKDFSGKKILLVEDNLLNQEITKEILSEAGFIVDVADDGDIAVSKMKYAKKGDYDLILMDIQMPRMDGYMATREIRTLPNLDIANIPIIATTANAFDDDKVKAIEAGMNAHISKPLDIDNFLEVIESILNE